MSAERPFVFLCHPHSVADYAAQLAQWLAERNIAVWYDQEIDPGTEWRPELAARLRACGALVVLVAPGNVDLFWINREINRAKAQNKRIFPLMMPGGTPIDALGALHYSKTVDGWPQASWVREVHDHLYPLNAEPVAEHPPSPRPRRRIVVAAAAAALAGLVGAAALGWWIGRGDETSVGGAPAARAVATPGGGCDGRSARIDKISMASPGHTGLQPELTVTVCVPAADNHEYWLMTYTEENGNRVFYAKARIDGAAGTRPYTAVIHKDATVGSSRTYVVASVPAERSAQVRTWIDADNAPLAPAGAAPEGLQLVSNEPVAVL
jgi:hypothetical protein